MPSTTKASCVFEEKDNMMYKIEGEDLYLIGTSEHSMIAKYKDKILSETLAVELLDKIENPDISSECVIGDEKVNISLKGI